MSNDLVTELRILSGSRKPYPSGAHGQMVGMETYRIVASGFALACIDEASDEIESLRQQLVLAQAKIDMLNSPVVLSDWQKLERQLADSQRSVVMLRDALKRLWNETNFEPVDYVDEALAATEPKEQGK